VVLRTTAVALSPERAGSLPRRGLIHKPRVALAHPGNRGRPVRFLPRRGWIGVHTVVRGLCNPFRGKDVGGRATQGALARPWAYGSNLFGVGRRGRVYRLQARKESICLNPKHTVRRTRGRISLKDGGIRLENSHDDDVLLGWQCISLRPLHEKD
jgi:hypothetical protein